MTTQQYSVRLQSGFFWFWVKNFRVSFMIIFLILAFGSFSLIQIPKESTPDIKFGIVAITTIYPWVNPVDIDNIITQKIEQEIKDLDGIKKLSSTSSIWISSTTIELENDVDVSKIINDIKDKVDVLTFPDDVQKPRVVEISTNNELLFRVALYGSGSQYSLDDIKNKAEILIDKLKWKDGIVDIQMGWGWFGAIGGRQSSTTQSEILVLVDKSKADQLWLGLVEISSALRSNNRNQPLWSHVIGDLSYDFRVQGEAEDMKALWEIAIRWTRTSYIKLKDIATIQKKYKSDNLSRVGTFDAKWFNGIEITFFKKPGGNLFTVSDATKKNIDNLLKSSQFNWLKAAYTFDLAWNVIKDYRDLANNGRQTIILVFLVAFLFIGWRESLITTLSFPLALFVTFAYLNSQGLSLNFLTNFSLILTFGMGIDTVMVVIESAFENVKKWFSPKHGVLVAIKDYAVPLISSAAANIIVFLPMIFLPGVTGKFLAYIPTTIFATLVASLFLALTINAAIFAKVISPLKQKVLDSDTGDVKRVNAYQDIDSDDALMTEDDKALLKSDREWKVLIVSGDESWRDKMLNVLSNSYWSALQSIISSRVRRLIWIISPLGVLILTFIFLSPQIGFKLFPSWDNPTVRFTISSVPGTDDKSLEKYVPSIESILATYPEIKTFLITTAGNNINVNLTLFDKEDRIAKNQRDSFKIQESVQKEFIVFERIWLKVESAVQAGGPPVGKAVGIQLVANSNQQLDELIRVSKIFENQIKMMTGVINTANSSTQTPGQFVFTFDQDELRRLWLSPAQLFPDLYLNLNGIKAGTLKTDGDERDIVLKFAQFENGAKPNDVTSMRINTPRGPILVGSVADYSFQSAISSIKREDNKVIVNVEADVAQWFTPIEVQGEIQKFADTFSYPSGIESIAKWENASQEDLIVATLVSFALAVFMIFLILVLQFNSFGQPWIILYVIVLALIGVNIGLRLTGNPYSMPMGIWFISLVGIIVNNAIVLIDKINSNLSKWASSEKAIVEAWRSRLRGIMISTISTIAGIFTVVFQDEFRAWLGYTVVFGLAFCTVLTLYVVPAMYYEFFLRHGEDSMVRPWISKYIIKPITKLAWNTMKNILKITKR